METRPVTHPSEDALRAFALGKLDQTASSALMNHLDDCPDCCKLVAALSGDDFLNRLRQAQGRSCTPTPAKALTDVAASLLSISQTPMPNLPPELAANLQYEVVRELGRGGMGVVYLAKNKLMDRLEVLKVINKSLLDRPGAVERFLREIRSAAKLSHAHVVTAYSAVQQGELLAFAMEYIEGQDLASVVKAQGPLPVANACYYVQQAALGLQHAFEKGMVHRDIKPQNLILARVGKKHTVKVLDFGLAKATREKAEDTGLTGEGAMLGTPDYVAPEQTLDAANADIRADIYSLGCTLYYLLAGTPPFKGRSLYEILQAHHSIEARSLNLVRSEVPEELATVVRKMMAKDPARRYQTPLEVVQALVPFIKPATTPKSASQPSSGSMEVKSSIKKPAPVDSPTPIAETAQKPPAPAEAWESLSESSITSVAPRKSGALRKRRAATVRERSSPKKWLIGGGIGGGALLLALVGMWAGGVFQEKTSEGTIVLEDLPADAEVVVDGAKITLQQAGDGEAIEIHLLPGERKLEIMKAGFKIQTEAVTLSEGERKPFKVRLEPLNTPRVEPRPPGPPGGGDKVAVAPKWLQPPRVNPRPLVKQGGGDKVARLPRRPQPPRINPRPPVTPGGGDKVALDGARQKLDTAEKNLDSKAIVGAAGSQAPPRQGEDGLPPEARQAATAFGKAREDARAKLLAGFDTALDRLAKIKGSAELRLKLIEAVKEEKKRFEDSGLIPWSEPMRPFLARYFASNAAAEDKVVRIYRSLLDARLRAKKEGTIADLQADLASLIGVRLLARWRHFGDGRPQGIRTLYSNGRIDRIDGKATWIYAQGVLIYRWPDPKAPGGVWIDTLHVSADGTAYAGTNNFPPGRRPKITGIYLKPD